MFVFRFGKGVTFFGFQHLFLSMCAATNRPTQRLERLAQKTHILTLAAIPFRVEVNNSLKKICHYKQTRKNQPSFLSCSVYNSLFCLRVVSSLRTSLCLTALCYADKLLFNGNQMMNGDWLRQLLVTNYLVQAGTDTSLNVYPGFMYMVWFVDDFEVWNCLLFQGCLFESISMCALFNSRPLVKKNPRGIWHFTC